MIDALSHHPFAGPMLAPVRPGAFAPNPQPMPLPPIAYRGVDMVAVSLAAPLDRLQDLVPAPLRARRMYGRYGCLALQFVRMPDTTLGPYQECVVSVACEDQTSWPEPQAHADWRPLPCYPLWLSVTTTAARDFGQRHWGYPKVLAPTEFAVSDENAAGMVKAVGGLDIHLSTRVEREVEPAALQIRSLTLMGEEVWKTDIRGQARLSQLAGVEVDLYLGRRTKISRLLADLGIVREALSVVYVEDFDYELASPFGVEEQRS
jgi:hypothetical protein